MKLIILFIGIHTVRSLDPLANTPRILREQVVFRKQSMDSSKAEQAKWESRLGGFSVIRQDPFHCTDEIILDSIPQSLIDRVPQSFKRLA